MIRNSNNNNNKSLKNLNKKKDNLKKILKIMLMQLIKNILKKNNLTNYCKSFSYYLKIKLARLQGVEP